MAFTETYVYESNIDEDESYIIFRKNSNVNHHIIAYKIEQIPEFDGEANEKYIESLLNQKVLIDTISNSYLLDKSFLNSVFELRIINSPTTKITSCYVILRLVIDKFKGKDYVELRENFKKILPDDYLFSEIDDAELSQILSHKKNIVEIKKSTELIPVGSITHNTELVNIFNPYEPLDKVQEAKYYIPVSIYVQPKAYNLSNLYKSIQDLNDEIVIRISISMRQVFDEEKTIALQFYKLLKTGYGYLNSTAINSFENAFTKYVINSHLYSVKVQVASENKSVALYIANSLCSQINYGDIETQTNFVNQLIMNDEIRSEWETCNHFYYPSFVNMNYGEDFFGKNIQAFMLRLPYLCDSNETIALFRLPVSNSGGLPGLIAKPVKPFYQPNPKTSVSTSYINLGKVITAAGGQNETPYSIPLSDLTKHGLIVGATGSGKTNTTLNFVSELIRKRIPFLLIEPVKSEYYDKLEPLFQKLDERYKLHRFSLKNPRLPDGSINSEFLRLNPFIPQPKISTYQHLSYMKSCFMAAFPMYGIMPLILEDCLYEYFKGDRFIEKGKKNSDSKSSQKILLARGLRELDFFDSNKSTQYYISRILTNANGTSETTNVNNHLRTILDFSHYISEYLESNKKLFDAKMRSDLEGSLNRRFIKLTKGLLGQVFCPENWRSDGLGWSEIPDNLDTILNKPCIIELEGLPENEDKALIMAFLLSYLFENRQTRHSHSSDNQLHVTLIEEAHRLLSASSVKATGNSEGASLSQDSGSKTVSLFIDMLAEIRAKNEAIFIIEQSPTKLVSDAIKNTNLKIMHRLTNKSDRDYLGEAMNMEGQQSRYATTLQQGDALVFDEQLDKPILVKMNKFSPNN